MNLLFHILNVRTKSDFYLFYNPIDFFLWSWPSPQLKPQPKPKQMKNQCADIFWKWCIEMISIYIIYWFIDNRVVVIFWFFLGLFDLVTRLGLLSTRLGLNLYLFKGNIYLYWFCIVFISKLYFIHLLQIDYYEPNEYNLVRYISISYILAYETFMFDLFFNFGFLHAYNKWFICSICENLSIKLKI